jgi:RNA polymerase sigma-70 factor (ECF subfamily)
MQGTETPTKAGRETRTGALAERARELDDVVSRNLRAFHQRAFRYLGNAPDAEDAVQDALLSAYKHVSQFRGQARISTWLTAIVINAARMKLRRRRGVWLSLEEEHTEDGLPWSERIADTRPDPEEVCFTSEAHDRLIEVAKQLSPTLRRTFQLRHIDGLTTKETARLLGVPEGTVKAQVARARAKLVGILRIKPRPQHSRNGARMPGYFMRPQQATGSSSAASE